MKYDILRTIPLNIHASQNENEHCTNGVCSINMYIAVLLHTMSLQIQSYTYQH